MDGRTLSAPEPVHPAVAAVAVAGPGILIVAVAGLGWLAGLPVAAGGFALHVMLLSHVAAGPALVALACRPGPEVRRRLASASLVAATLLPLLASVLLAMPWTQALPAIVLAQAACLVWLALPGAAMRGRRGMAGTVLGLGLAATGGVMTLATGSGLLWTLAAIASAVALVLHLVVRNGMAVGTAGAGDLRQRLIIGGALACGWWWDAWASWHGAGMPGPVWSLPAEGVVQLIARSVALPALALGLVRIGRAFHHQQIRFRATVLQGGDLASIITAKQDLVAALQRELGLVLRLQAMIALALVFCAPPLVRMLGLSAAALPGMCLAAVGTSLAVPLMLLAQVLLVGGWHRDAQRMALGFAVTGGLATLPAWWSAHVSDGWGLVVGAAAGLAIGFSALRRHLADLEYETLAREPLRTV